MTDRMLSLFTELQYVAAACFGASFVMTSGDRTCAQQRAVSTERNSLHTVGSAFDAVVTPWDPDAQAALGAYAEERGFRWGGNFKTGDYAHDVVHFDDGRRVRAGTC
jgi:D-alanyl-D-alanine carboxypeptidase-like protein